MTDKHSDLLTVSKPQLKRLRVAVALSLFLLLMSCSNKIKLIDTDAQIPRIDGDVLWVTNSEGEPLSLPIKRPSVESQVKTACPASVYESIGSLTYVEKIMAEEDYESIEESLRRMVELGLHIFQIRDQLASDFAASYPQVAAEVVRCNLVLQPDDLIYKRLRFVGPRSSDLTVECLGRGEQRAQIRNPLDTATIRSKDSGDNENKFAVMLSFEPGNCGLEPLSDGEYVDELGGVKSSCDPVKNVKINNCRVRGRVSARSFGGDLFELSSVRSDHVERLQASAAQHVSLTGMQIQGRYKGAIHLLPGVHHFNIEDSEILGGFHSMTIHLPADGGWNVIKNNRITGQRKIDAAIFSYDNKEREVISIDSSEHNRIINNHISDMSFGGIHLYRNCGESGSVRHRIPQYNQIINNVFDYSSGRQSEPTIFIGTRDDISNTVGGVKRYCSDDTGESDRPYPSNDVREYWDNTTVLSSSESNDDWAQNNVIAENQWIQYNPDDGLEPIKRSDKAQKLVNYLIGNETAAERTVQTALDIQAERGAGCAVLAGITDGMAAPYTDPTSNGHLPYIRHGQMVKYYWNNRPVVQLACGTPKVCFDNILKPDSSIACEAPIIEDYGNESQPCDASNVVCAEGDNDGDNHTLGCSGGQLIGIQAACNLEFGKVTDADREQVLMNRIKITKPSKNLDDGNCGADGVNIKQGERLITPWLFSSYSGDVYDELLYSCREYDRNGGDCHISIRHYCEPN